MAAGLAGAHRGAGAAVAGAFLGEELAALHESLGKIRSGEPLPPDADRELILSWQPALDRADEWVYLFVLGVLEGGLGLPFLLRLACGNPGLDPEQVHLHPLPVEATRLLEYVCTWLQKTAENKIHYSVVLELQATKLDADDFYASTKNSNLAGLRIRLADLQLLLRLYGSAVRHFLGLPALPASTDGLALIHLLVKFLVAASFLGAYNKPVQSLLFPDALELTARLLEHLHSQYYLAKVPVNREAVFGLHTDTVRLAGNIVHVNREAQDFLIEAQLLAPLLRFTAPDSNSPLSREASIVFIRYMSESNPKAAECIQALRVYDLTDEKNKLYSKVDFL